MHTKDRLAAELEKIGLPGMAESARAGQYDDFLSEVATPQLLLLSDLHKVGTADAMALRVRVMEGEFDATKEESDAWSKSEDGKAAFNQLFGRRHGG